MDTISEIGTLILLRTKEPEFGGKITQWFSRTLCYEEATLSVTGGSDSFFTSGSYPGTHPP